MCPAQRTLSILSWNIFMMPPWVHESPRNAERSAAIAVSLLDESFDIVCLQKVFDPGARLVLERMLGERYPYRYGPANDGASLLLNSGVWVLSKHPLTDYRVIEFDDCSGIECLSRKGAMLLSGRCGVAPFRLIVTHLQGEEGSHFTRKNERVRHAQMLAIREQLIVPNLEYGVPFILCGDFGTPRFDADGKTESAVYRDMMTTFAATNGSEPRMTLDETPEGNQLVKDGSGRVNELDYVLVRPNDARVSALRVRRMFRRGGWDDARTGRVDLSYRYAVAAMVGFA